MISVTVTLLVVGLILTGQAKTAAQILSSHKVRTCLARGGYDRGPLESDFIFLFQSFRKSIWKNQNFIKQF